MTNDERDAEVLRLRKVIANLQAQRSHLFAELDTVRANATRGWPRSPTCARTITHNRAIAAQTERGAYD